MKKVIAVCFNRVGRRKNIINDRLKWQVGRKDRYFQAEGLMLRREP